MNAVFDKPTIVDFSTTELTGAKDPVRVKFALGYNAGNRSARLGHVPLEGIHRATRSVPFLAGYDVARIDYRNPFPPNTSEEITAAIDRAYRVYVSTHTGTDMSWSTLLLRNRR